MLRHNFKAITLNVIMLSVAGTLLNNFSTNAVGHDDYYKRRDNTSSISQI